MVSISVILPTAREDYPITGLPNLHMFQPTIESLKIQSFKNFELIIVDGLHHLRPNLFEGQPFDKKKLPFNVRHVPIALTPKFNHRFWMDNGRWNVCGTLNTGIIHARGELLVRIDDCSEFESDYLKKFWEGYQNGYWPCAMHIRYLEGKPARLNKEYIEKGYEANNPISIEFNKEGRDNLLKRLYGENGLIRDTRYDIVKKEGGRKIAPPEWYYGYSSVSLEAALKVNGYDELFDADKSLEDTDMGSRLEMAGYKNKFLLDISNQVIEHEHGPITENLIENNVKPIKCVHPDTIIMLNNIPIEIKKLVKLNGLPEDKKKIYRTLTKNGVYRPIREVLKRSYDGEILKIIPYYTNIPLIISSEHKILVSDKNKNKRWADAGDVLVTDYVLYPRIKENSSVKSIKISSYVGTLGKFAGCRLADGIWYSWRNQYGNKRIKDDIIINSEFMKLVGYYLGEGSTTFSSADQINFSFNNDEEELIMEVIKLMKNIFGIIPTSAKMEKTAFVIRYISKILSVFFDKLLGKCGTEKKLPSWFLGLDNNLIKDFIKTTYLSEGVSKDPSNREKGSIDRGGYYQLNTSSMTFAYQLRLLFNKLGIPVKFWKKIPNPKNFSILPDGRKIIPKSIMYYMQIPNEYGNIMEEITGVLLPIEIENRRQFNFEYPINLVDNDYIYINIREIVREKYEGELYNLEVIDEDIDDGTYTANGISIHNCNYAIYLINRKRNRWKANSGILSEKDVEFIRSESLRPPCSPIPNFYDENCNGKMFDIWVRNQPMFDLKDERKYYKD